MASYEGSGAFAGPITSNTLSLGIGGDSGWHKHI